MNDYLMLGATLGVPALVCFAVYVGLSLTGKGEGGGMKEVICGTKDNTELKELAWLKAVCCSGALVLAVGFWFDGGLFKLTCAS
jgi:hypothetical protein